MVSKKIALMFLMIIPMLLITSPATRGQTTGKLKGQIVDTASAGIEWAQVVVTKGSAECEIKVDSEGKYELALPEGDYELVGRARGFRSSDKIKVKVIAGQTTEINLSLDVNMDNPPCLLKVEGVSEQTKTQQKEKQKGETPERTAKDKKGKPRP